MFAVTPVASTLNVPVKSKSHSYKSIVPVAILLALASKLAVLSAQTSETENKASGFGKISIVC